MDSFKCRVCGYSYNAERGDPGANVPPGTAFKDIPDSWVCPVCGARKEQFREERN